MLLNQQLREVKWENWFAKIQEYDTDITPLKEIKIQELCKLIADNDSLNGLIYYSVGKPMLTSEWYKDIILYFISRQFSNNMTPKEIRALKMKSNQYVLAIKYLLIRNHDGILLRCVYSNKSQ